MKIALFFLATAACATLVLSMPQYKGGPPPHKHDGYFQYVNVPGHKEYEFGWKKGNPHHFISRFEQAKGHRFRTRVKWGDTKDGYGEHYWEYNHAPKYKHDGYGHNDHKHGGYDDKHIHHGGHKGYPSDHIEVIHAKSDDNGQEVQFKE